MPRHRVARAGTADEMLRLRSRPLTAAATIAATCADRHAVASIARTTVLRDLPVELAGRIPGGRVMRLPKARRIYDSKGGRPPKHGPKFRFARPETCSEPAVTSHTVTTNYGKAVTSMGRVHRGCPPGRLAGPRRRTSADRGSVGPAGG